jgi:hypothetical protein
MPIDLGRRQTIEEITNGRIKKKSSEELRRPPREEPRRVTAEKMVRQKR